MRFLRYNCTGLHFQESRVVLNDSAFKNRWDRVFSNIFRHKQGTYERKTEKKHICMHRFVIWFSTDVYVWPLNDINTPCAGASTLAARQRSTLTRITKISDFGRFLQSFFKFEHSIVFSSSRRSKWVQLQPFWTLLFGTALREVLSSNVVSPHVSVHCAAPERPRKKRREL